MKNNKGFMLVEVIVVSIVLMGTLVGLYAGFNRLYTNYKARNRYYSIDALNALGTINDFLTNEMDMNNLMYDLTDATTSPASVLSSSNDSNPYNSYINLLLNYGQCDLDAENGNKDTYFCKIVQSYNIKKLYLSTKNVTNITTDDNDFRLYLTYLDKQIEQMENPTMYNYLIIQLSDSTNTYNYYGYLKINNSGTRRYVDPILNGADPILNEGMIPIYFDGNTIRKANIKKEWYNYSERKWANVVLVKKEKRKYYKEAIGGPIEDHIRPGIDLDGTVIDEEDILAYFVWIPRYRYKLFNVLGENLTENLASFHNGSCIGNCGAVRNLSIVFESKSRIKSLGKNNGEWLTHPGFTFGNEELNGLWVGKFETSIGEDEKPKIIPGVEALVNQNASTQFGTALKFKSDYYGLTVNSRMLKNSEWGAIEYLTLAHTYGWGIAIFSNLNIYSEDKITGTKKFDDHDEVFGQYTGTCIIPDTQDSYEEYCYYSSTTGNITGVFDMTGINYERVMSLYQIENSFYTGFDTINNSNYNGKLGEFENSTIIDNGNMTNGVNLPLSKYYDIYTCSRKENMCNFNKVCNGKVCLGHAISETKNWGNDETINNFGWITRGGCYSSGSVTGINHYSASAGGASPYITFRTVIGS